MPSLRSATWFMRALSPGTLSRPSFPNPDEVVMTAFRDGYGARWRFLQAKLLLDAAIRAEG